MSTLETSPSSQRVTIGWRVSAKIHHIFQDTPLGTKVQVYGEY
ncbi:hypothetical protein [Kribbella solani]|nr:hypothetical protein [Kribbella solani]MDX2971781.1 hypothetical protein [Kribbella solani]